jgi:hypothetical protein
MTIEYATRSEIAPAGPSRAAVVTGWVLGVLPAALFIFSASMKLMPPPGSEKGYEQMGVPYHYALGLGILELGCAVVYLIPRTAVLGAILLTGYLGGAIMTHLRIGQHIYYVHVLIGVALWLGLYLREPRLRAVIPVRS